MSIESIVNPIIKRCVDCNKETKKQTKERCRHCYQIYIRTIKHLNSPLKKCECSKECKAMIHSIGKGGIPVKYADNHKPKVCLNEVCIKCGNKDIYYTKELCKKCYTIIHTYEKHLNSPMVKCQCKPECLVMIHSISESGQSVKYAKGHRPKGQYNKSWKGGRRKNGKYWIILWPDHPNAESTGYLPEHVYNFTEYNKCCMLPWGVVHHIEPVIRDYCNNMPWNLQGMTRSAHFKHHRPKMDFNGRLCSICGSSKTFMKKGKYADWRGNEIEGYRCNTCDCRIKRQLRKTQTFL